MVNPLDHTNAVWGDVDGVAGIVEVLASDPEVGVVLALQDQPADLPDDAAAQWRDTLEGDVRGVTAAGVPLVIASTLPDHRPDREGALGGLRAGLLAAAALVAPLPADGAQLRAIARAAIRPDGPARSAHLAESDGKSVLREAGVTVPDFVVSRDAAAAAASYEQLGGRVVVKASHPDLLHKSDVGAVVLGLDDADGVRAAAERVLAAAPEGSLVLVERMADPGLELFVAAHRDGVVPVLVMGLGGVWAEVLDDVAVIPLPADVERVEAALLSLRAAPVLTGARGGEPYALRSAAELGARVGELLLRTGLSLVELNPVLLGRGSTAAVAVDAVVRT